METPIIKRFLIPLLLFLVLASCRTGNNVIVVSTMTPMSQGLSRPTTLPSFTPTVIAMPTVSLDVTSYQCLDVADHPPSNYIMKGTIVYNNDDNTDAFLSDHDTNNVYLFPREEGDRLWGFNVSPDGKHIVYMHSNASNEKVVVATADGKTVWSQITDSFLWNWFDNERLVNLLVPETGSPSLILLDPFSGERQELRADYPNSEMFSNEWYARWRYTRGGLPIYDPMLTRVIYPQTRSQSGATGWPIVLWDTKENKVVRKIETMHYWGETPIWMPDGKQFIIAANMDSNENPASAKEFFAVNRDGEVKQLTHFKDYYQEINIPDNYSLSPNGKLLAFWISAKPSQFDDLRLAVLNIENGDVTNYCIKGDPFLDIETTPPGPIWSPDSAQLLVVSRNPQDAKIRRIVLMDLVRNYAAQIAEDVEPVGWMTAP